MGQYVSLNAKRPASYFTENATYMTAIHHNEGCPARLPLPCAPDRVLYVGFGSARQLRGRVRGGRVHGSSVPCRSPEDGAIVQLRGRQHSSASWKAMVLPASTEREWGVTAHLYRRLRRQDTQPHLKVKAPARRIWLESADAM